MTRMTVHTGDITEVEADAIVNAANEELEPGGGVCGAIFRAAGRGLAEECAAIGGCATGDAVITGGHGLAPARIIHAVGPVWRGGGGGEAALLAQTYVRALNLAAWEGCQSVAFPAISTGVYGFPADQAARIAVEAVASALADTPTIDTVIFCCFSEESAALHRAALDRLGA